jgi:hypothetical protein
MSLPEELTRGRKRFNSTSLDSYCKPKVNARLAAAQARRRETRRGIDEYLERAWIESESSSF